jgi:hypothetical protein
MIIELKASGDDEEEARVVVELHSLRRAAASVFQSDQRSRDHLRRGTQPISLGIEIVRPNVEPEIRGGDPLSTDPSTARIAGRR